MGLDMYLSAKRRPAQGADQEPGRLEGFEAMYWRKANHIHRWFVENVQDGTDDCRSYPVTHAQLRELARLCREVLDDPKRAPQLLPTRSGFFFGTTEYDEFYLADTRETAERLERLLAELDAEQWEFQYQSDW